MSAGFRFQPVDADEVAARLVELALGEPAGLVPDLGGPTAYGMDELVRSYLRAMGRRRPIVRLRLPGRAAEAIRNGANLAPDRAVGVRTWADEAAQVRTPTAPVRRGWRRTASAAPPAAAAARSVGAAPMARR